MAAIRLAGTADAVAIAALLPELGYPAEVGAARQAEGAAFGLLALHWGAMLHITKPVARIGTLVTVTGARRRGIGALLLRHAAVLARAQGCASLELTTGLARQEAHAFHEAQGFTRASLCFVRALEGG
jgi:PhnO protein